ncbi:MAG: acyl carrier protein [Pseudomonadota bacterium]
MTVDRSTLISFLTNNFDVVKDDINDDTPLFSTGVLDSFGMIELVGFIEKTAGIKFGVLDLNLENLDSINRVIHYVDAKTAR